MKRMIPLFFALVSNIMCFSQQDTTAPYLKNKILPDFSLLDIDSVAFTKKVLAENKNTIIMLFNPECDHCQHQLELFLSMPAIAASTQLILSSIETQEKNRAFYNKYHLEKYPFIHLGRDHKYFFGKYFRPATIPVLAFYNTKREFVLLHQGTMKKKAVLKVLGG